MVTAVVARFLGYVRDWFIYTHFGESYLTDAFNAAFSIPDFIYMLLVGGALSSAFMPVFASLLATDDEDSAWKMASVVLNYTMLALVVLVAIAFFNTPALIQLLAPKLPAEYQQLAAFLTRIMFLQTFFMALNGLAMGVLNSREHFLTPALGGIVYNLGIIICGVALVDKLGIAAFSYGVVVGAALNFMIQIPALAKVGVRYLPSFDYHNPHFKQVLILMLPVIIGLSVTQFNLFVSQNLASGLQEGSITALRISQRLMQLPLGIFAVSIAIAVFPTLTAQAAREEMIGFRRTLGLGLSSVFFITLPAAAGLMAIGEPAIKLLFEWKNFTSSHAEATAQALYFYSLGLFAYSGLQVANRLFYALKDTITPVAVAVVTIALNIGLSIILVKPLDIRGLALAYSLAGVFNLLLLLIILRIKIGHLGGRKLVAGFTWALINSVLVYIAAKGCIWLLLPLLDFAPKVNQLIAVSTAITAGVGVYALMSLFLHMEEATLILNLIKSKLTFLHRA